MFVATADNIYEMGEVGRGSKIKKEVGEKKIRKSCTTQSTELGNQGKLTTFETDYSKRAETK